MNHTGGGTPKLYATGEAATYLGVPSKSLYRLVYDGHLERIMQGGNQYFTREALDTYKSQREAQSIEENGVKTERSNEQPVSEQFQNPVMYDALTAVQAAIILATEREEKRSKSLLAALKAIRATIDDAIAEHEDNQ